MKSKSQLAGRCLILLDLQNFGQINKKFNHWIGDEYLRRFAEMVSSSGRRNEYLFKRRPLKTPQQNEEKESSARQAARAFRKNSGGDEFFILLEGTVVDALGYLIRLRKRAPEFEAMSFDVMGARHRFGFYAGVVPIALNEPFESVSKRVSECVGLAMEKGGPQWVYWVETDIPERLDAFQKKIVEEAKKIFARHHVEESTLIPGR